MHDTLLQFERAFDRRNPFRGEVKIFDRGFDVGVAKQALKNKDIGALVKLVGGKTMAQGVNAAALGQAGFFFASP
jgi:hypothetical protein